MISFVLSAPDRQPLPGYCWRPNSSPRAVVQIVHGLAEHAGRYAELAANLSAVGYVVYASDLRGHGPATVANDLGFFAQTNGWHKCLDDLALLHRHIGAENPGLPRFLLGHSMGSFLVQQFLCEHGDGLSGAVLAGSDGAPSILAAAGRLVARLERLRLGQGGRSALLQALAFGAFNKSFRPARTPFDWLSRDSAEVDRYIHDALCGFTPTVQLWIDLLDAWAHLSKSSQQAQIPKTLPVHIIAGTRDPVSANTRGLEKLLRAYRRAGLERITHRFYEGARHELFHETNRAEVTRDLIAWLDEVAGHSVDTATA